MTALRFVSCDRNVLYLMPPLIQGWRADNHMARFIVHVVLQVDVGSLDDAHGAEGLMAILRGCSSPSYRMAMARGYLPAADWRPAPMGL